MTGDLKQLIETEFRKMFPEWKLSDVKIEEKQDWEGDRVFKIWVVYQTRGDKERLDAARTVKFSRVLHDALSAKDKDFPGIPVISYVLKNEWDKMEREAC